MPSFAKCAWLAVASVLIVPAALTQTTAKGSIEGDVVDVSTGQGIPGARVRIQAGQDEPMMATADKEGQFKIEGLKFGSYELTPQYPGYVSAIDIRASGRDRVSLTPRTAVAHIRLEMRRYGAIVGKVTDALGIPVERVSVQAFQRSTSGANRRPMRGPESDPNYVLADMTWTDDLGQYRFAPLAAGSYVVAVQAQMSRNMDFVRPPPDIQERETFYPHALKIAQAKLIPVGEGTETRADVQLISQTGVKLSGRVHGAAGADIRVTAVPGDGYPVFAQMSGDRFTFVDLLPGKYVLEAAEYSAGDVPMHSSAASGTRTVEIGKEDITGVEINLAATPNVRGVVVFENGCTPVPVWIQLQSGRRVRDFQISTAGDFVMPHLFPDNYKMYVRPDGQPFSSAVSAKLGESEVLKDGFNVDAGTTGPLRITMSCVRK